MEEVEDAALSSSNQHADGLVPARGEKRGPVDFHRSQNSNLGGGERSPTVCLA